MSFPTFPWASPLRPSTWRSNPSCPGLATETEDPLGAVTKTTHDPTCAFQLTTTNALGHTVSQEYFGVDGVGYTDGATRSGGLYGLLKSVTDPNGGRSFTNYDEWGRVIATVGPYDTPDRPGARTTYADPLCRDASGAIGCASPLAREIAGRRMVEQARE